MSRVEWVQLTAIILAAFAFALGMSIGAKIRGCSANEEAGALPRYTQQCEVLGQSLGCSSFSARPEGDNQCYCLVGENRLTYPRDFE